MTLPDLSSRKPSRRRGYPGPPRASRSSRGPGSERCSLSARIAPSGMTGMLRAAASLAAAAVAIAIAVLRRDPARPSAARPTST